MTIALLNDLCTVKSNGKHYYLILVLFLWLISADVIIMVNTETELN